MSERSRREYQAFIEAENKQQNEIVGKLEAESELKRLQKEVSINAGKLMQAQRKLVLGYTESPFVPPDLAQRMFDIDEELEQFNRAEARAFYLECAPLGWNGTPENIATILAYFRNRNIGEGLAFPVIDRRMYKSAFLSLRKDGLFEEPEPVPEPDPVAAPKSDDEDFSNLARLPLSHQTPVSYRRDIQQAHQGIDPDTGKQRKYTQVEVDRMDSETFKRTFNVPTPVLTRVNFLR